MIQIKVIKRDGSIEDFDVEKIANVIKTAGLSTEQSQFIAEKVQRWLEDREQPVVSSFIIRMKIVEEVGKVDKHAAELYTWYGKTKDESKKQQEANNA